MRMHKDLWYAEQLEERIAKIDAVISSLVRAIQLLADSEGAKSRSRDDQEQELEFRIKLEQEKQLEEMRIEMRNSPRRKKIQKQSCQNWLFLSLRVQPWISSGSPFHI